MQHRLHSQWLFPLLLPSSTWCPQWARGSCLQWDGVTSEWPSGHPTPSCSRSVPYSNGWSNSHPRAHGIAPREQVCHRAEREKRCPQAGQSYRVPWTQVCQEVLQEAHLLCLLQGDVLVSNVLRARYIHAYIRSTVLYVWGIGQSAVCLGMTQGWAIAVETDWNVRHFDRRGLGQLQCHSRHWTSVQCQYINLVTSLWTRDVLFPPRGFRTKSCQCQTCTYVVHEKCMESVLNRCTEAATTSAGTMVSVWCCRVCGIVECVVLAWWLATPQPSHGAWVFLHTQGTQIYIRMYCTDIRSTNSVYEIFYHRSPLEWET